MSKFTEDIYGKKIQTKDGRVGSLIDLQFDETDWDIRFMVWRRESWFPRAKLLLPEHAFSHLVPEIDSYYFAKQDCSKRNVPRREEAEEDYADAGDDPVAYRKPLLSSRGLTGYRILAKDGSPGAVGGLLVDLASWKVSHLVAETGQWLSRRQTLIDPVSVTHISRESRSITVDLAMQEIGRLPKIVDISRLMYAMRVARWRAV